MRTAMDISETQIRNSSEQLQKYPPTHTLDLNDASLDYHYLVRRPPARQPPAAVVVVSVAVAMAVAVAVVVIVVVV